MYRSKDSVSQNKVYRSLHIIITSDKLVDVEIFMVRYRYQNFLNKCAMLKCLKGKFIILSGTCV